MGWTVARARAAVVRGLTSAPAGPDRVVAVEAAHWLFDRLDELARRLRELEQTSRVDPK